MSCRFFILVFCLIFGTGSVCFAQEKKQEILKDLNARLPENSEIAYAGKYTANQSEHYYVFYRSKNSHSCASLRLKVGNSPEQLKDVRVHDVICNHGLSTIVMTVEGTFYFPAAWQRQSVTKAALNGKIYLQEFKFLEEEK